MSATPRPALRLLTPLALLLLLLAGGMVWVTQDFTYRAWFHDDDPHLAAFDEFQRTFGNDDVLACVVRRPRGQGDLFTPEGARLVAYLLTGGDCGGGTPTDPFDQAHSYIAASDSTAVPGAGETEIGGSVLATIQCDTGWPVYANRRVEWRATFLDTIGTGTWGRVSLQNGASEPCVNFDLFKLPEVQSWVKGADDVWWVYIGVTI